MSERRSFENYSSRRQSRTPQVRNSSFRKSHSQSFLRSDLKNDNFSVIFQQFLNGNFAGFLERVIFLIRSIFLIFIVNPCVRIYESVKADNKKRLNLEGFEKIRKHRANYMLFLFICLLLLIGLVVMFSLSPQRANSLNIAKGANYDDYCGWFGLLFCNEGNSAQLDFFEIITILYLFSNFMCSSCRLSVV